MKNFDSIRLKKNHVIVGPGTMKGQLDIVLKNSIRLKKNQKGKFFLKKSRQIHQLVHFVQLVECWQIIQAVVEV